jgi:hypothetical protein
MFFVCRFEGVQQSKPMSSFVHDYLATGVVHIAISLCNIRTQDNSISVEALRIRISWEVPAVKKDQRGFKERKMAVLTPNRNGSYLEAW